MKHNIIEIHIYNCNELRLETLGNHLQKGENSSPFEKGVNQCCFISEKVDKMRISGLKKKKKKGKEEKRLTEGQPCYIFVSELPILTTASHKTGEASGLAGIKKAPIPLRLHLLYLES